MPAERQIQTSISFSLFLNFYCCFTGYADNTSSLLSPIIIFNVLSPADVSRPCRMTGISSGRLPLTFPGSKPLEDDRYLVRQAAPDFPGVETYDNVTSLAWPDDAWLAPERKTFRKCRAVHAQGKAGLPVNAIRSTCSSLPLIRTMVCLSSSGPIL